MANADLAADLEALNQEATRYPGTRATLLPDFALYAFATDVREQSRAVLMLASSSVPRTAFTNARAALESALDAAYLVLDEGKYDFRGAQARVAELYEGHEIERRASPFRMALPEGAPARMHPVDVIAEDAIAWDADAPGKGDILRRAWESFTKDPGASRKHWSMETKEAIYSAVFPDTDNEGIAGMTDVIHALLSMASHPRMRTGTRTIEMTEDGGIYLGTRETDADMARDVAAFACQVAKGALQLRRTFATEVT